MTVFLDTKDNEYLAQTNLKVTHAVNGELSISGEILSNDEVLQKIERGWRLKFEDEYFYITYQKLHDENKSIRVEFDAIHQFFWDFSKSSVYEELDGEFSFGKYLEFIFQGSGYRYHINPNLITNKYNKQNFGFKKRLPLFNDIVQSAGVEFNVKGKVVSFFKEVGTDLSTVVRKNLNLNELIVTRNIGDFITYQKGFGKWKDKNDHSKGRLEVEYESPLAKIYGRLEGEPIVDERYTVAENLLQIIKKNVENSYSLSIEMSMEDLTKAGYAYSQPQEGDYVMVIDETLGFKQRVRIVSYTSQYDVYNHLVDHQVICNDVGVVKRRDSNYSNLVNKVNASDQNTNQALKIANQALVSADGKNTNYYGDTFPLDVPKGTLNKGDLFYQQVGDRVIMHVWNGSEWVADPVVNELGALAEEIDKKFDEVSKSINDSAAEHSKKVSEIELAATEQDKVIKEQGQSLASVIHTAEGLVSRVKEMQDAQNLVYDPTHYSKFKKRNPGTRDLVKTGTGTYDLLRITESGYTAPAWRGFQMPLHSSRFIKGEKLSYRVSVWVDVLPDDIIGIRIANSDAIIAGFDLTVEKTGSNQVFTGTFEVQQTTLVTDDYGLHVWLRKNGTIAFGQLSIVRGGTPPENFVDSTSAQQVATETVVGQLAGSWAVQNLTSAGTVLNQINLNRDGSIKIDGKLVQITGTTYIQDGVISSAKIANVDAGKIKTGTLDAAKVNVINLNANNIVGLDATFIKAKIELAMIEWMRGKIIQGTNDNMTIDLNGGNVLFKSGSNAIKRVKGTHTAFVHFNDTDPRSDSGVGSLYASIGVTSSGDGINSFSSGRFAGFRAFRGARGAEHTAVIDRAEVYGDTIYLKDDFTLDRGLRIRPAEMTRMYDLDRDILNPIRFLHNFIIHLNNAGWDTKHHTFINAVLEEWKKSNMGIYGPWAKVNYP